MEKRRRDNIASLIVAGIFGTVFGTIGFYLFIASPNVFIRIAMISGFILSIIILFYPTRKGKEKKNEERILEASKESGTGKEVD